MRDWTDWVSWGVTAIAFIASLILCSVMEQRRRREHPAARPYAWGYYNGLMGSITGTIWLLVTLYGLFTSYGRGRDHLFPWALYLTLFVISHLLILARNKIGWAVGVPLQLNPILWVINFIYARNRWGEFGGVQHLSTLITKPFAANPRFWRIFLALSVFWALIVVVIVWAFEPYGHYVSDHNKMRTLKIVVAPPILAGLGFAVWRWITGQGKQN